MKKLINLEKYSIKNSSNILGGSDVNHAGFWRYVWNHIYTPDDDGTFKGGIVSGVER